MKLVVLAVGKLRDAGLRSLADEYLKRIQRYAKVREVEVKTAAQLAGRLPAGAITVVLEVDGQSMTSTELSERVIQWAGRGGSVCFVIGGAEGLPSDLSRRADARLSLSRMTLPHRLARVVLLEQLYRAMTIWRGDPYAREG